MRSRNMRVAIISATCVVLAACGGGGGDVVNPPAQTGSFIVTLSASTLTLAPGATQTLIVTVTRTGGFAGAVSLAATPLPANVTASFAPAQLSAGVTSSTLTIVAGATAVNGLTAITVTGTSPGIGNQSAGLQFTIATPVQGPASFSILPSVTAFVSPPAATLVHIPTIAITRDAGYTGAITFSVTGLPPTVAAVVTPAVATGSTASLPIVNVGAPAGTYTATIRAVGANGGGERTATVDVVVAPATAGSITWRICSSAPRYPSYFVAVKDGAGAWSRIVPGNDGTTYSFNLTQPTASVAWVTIDSGVARTTVYNATQSEISALAASDCTLYQNGSTRNALGTVTGLAASQLSLVGMGWWVASTTNSSGGTISNYNLLNLPSGNLDLIAVRTATDANFQTVADRVVIRRGLNPATGGSNTLIDFNATEAIATTASTWTINNAGGESFGMTELFTTASGSTGQFTPGPGIDRATTTRTIYGVPAAQTVAGDLHQVVFTIGTVAAQRASRQIVTYQRTIANRTVSFGSVLPTPAVSGVSVATAGLVRAQGTLPTEYNSAVTLDVKSTGSAPRFATVHTTRGFLGGSGTYDVRMPDLTQVLGWDRTWSIRPGDVTNWWVSGGGALLDYFDSRTIFFTTQRNWTGTLPGLVAPADGNTFLFGRATGTVTP